MAAWDDAFRRYRDATDQWLQAEIARRLDGPYKQLARRLAKALETGGLSAMLRVYDELLRELGQERQGVLDEAMTQAKTRAVEAFGYAVQRRYGTAFSRRLLEPEPGQTLPPVLQRLGRGSPSAGEFALTGPQRRGYQFSERFWKSDQQTRQEMQVFLQRHLTTGAGAIRMAKEFARFAADDPALPVHLQRLERSAREALQGQPDARQRFLDALKRVKEVIAERQEGPLGTRGFQKTVAQRLAKAVKEGSQQRADEAIDYFINRRARYRATVVLRTETNRSFRESSVAQYARHDFVLGLEWVLSRQHAHVDECDAFARADLGYGRGIYPRDQLPQSHPNCLCIVRPTLAPPEEAATARPYEATPQEAAQFQRLQERVSRQANRIGQRVGTNRTAGLRRLQELFEDENLI